MKSHSMLFVSLFFAACAAQTPAPGNAPADGALPAEKAASTQASELPDFTLSTTEGERFTLSDHVGKDVIVLSFWATWCAPCLTELPHLEALYQAEKDNGLLIAAISMDEPSSVAEVAPTAARIGLTMPVLLDTDQRAVQLYNRSRNAPMTVVIDKTGKIVRASAGYEVGDEVKLAAEVRTLLK